MNKMWEPKFDDWSEGKVSMSPCELATSSMSQNEYGVIMQMGMDDDHLPIDAAIFWTDEMHLYLRYDWGTWYRVSNDDPDNCSNICKRNSAKLLLCTMSSVKHHAVRVYHIDKLPEELFGRQTDDSLDSADTTQLDREDPPAPVISLEGTGTSPLEMNISEPFPKDSDEENEVEKQVDAFVAQTMPLDLEIQAAVDAEIERRGGRVYSRFRPGNNRLYSFDFVQIGKRFFTIVYADFAGDWLADEDAFLGEPPLWFSENEHRVSPVFQAVKCRSFFRKELPQIITIDSIVVVPKKCVVINDEEMQECWREKCDTAVVRVQKIKETVLQTLHEHLASQPVDDIEVPELDTVEMVGISSRFTMNPENWINKD